MSLAIFNITNDTLNMAVSLAVFALVVIWLAMIAYTYLDARRRIEDPFLVGCAAIASLFPYIGTAVYAILRPPELLADAREREIEVQAAELRLRHLTEQSCPGCGYPIDRRYLGCPDCGRHLKDPCETCSRPVDPRWELCPYCEAEIRSRKSRSSSESSRSGKSSKSGRSRSGASSKSGASSRSGGSSKSGSASRSGGSGGGKSGKGSSPASDRDDSRSGDRTGDEGGSRSSSAASDR